MMNNMMLLVSDWMCMRFSVAIMCLVVIVSKVVKRVRRCDNRKNVFVYANDLLGDTMVKFPFFFALREQFPAERYNIVVVLSPVMAECLRKLVLFDEVVEEPPLHWRHSIFWLFGRGGMAKSLRWAFRNKAEVMIVCHRSRSLGCDFALRLCNPSVSVAYSADIKTPMLPMTARYQAKICDKHYTYLLEAKDGCHQMEDMDSLLSFATGHHVKTQRLRYDKIMEAFDFSLVNQHNLGEYMVLVPGARVGYRRWPICRFVDVARKLGGRIVVVGTTEEAALANEIALKCKCEVVNLCGKTTLAQLGGVLARAKLVITNETGTANYSAITGAKTICILGGGDYGAFFPNEVSKNTISVCHKESCFNCGWNCTKRKLSGSVVAPCIDAVTVEDVLAAVYNGC